MSINAAINASKAHLSRRLESDGASEPTSQPKAGQRHNPAGESASNESSSSIAGGLAQSPTTADSLLRARTQLDVLHEQHTPSGGQRPNADAPTAVIPFLSSGNRISIPDVGSGPASQTREQWLYGVVTPIGIPSEPAESVIADEPGRHPYDRRVPNAIELDKPDADVLELSAEALANGDIDKALDTALNSEGDSVLVGISVGVSIPTPAGPSIGVDGSLQVQLQRTADDKYEVSLTTEQAVSLGLEVSDELKVQAELGFETRAVYRFDSRDEAINGLKDLAITAGGVSSGLSDRVSDLEKVGDGVDNAANNPVTDIAASVPDIFFPGGRNPVRDIQDIADQFESGTDAVNNVVGGAQQRLDDAFVSYEVSGIVGRDLNVGLPDSESGQSIDLGIELAIDQKFTTRVNSDGTATVSVTQSATGSGNVGGPGGPTTRATGQASVTVTQELVRDDGIIKPSGSPTVTLSLDASTQTTVGEFVTSSIGTGQRLTYEFEASELNDGGREAIDRFLRGDTRGALEALGDIEGDLTIQARTTSSLGVEAEFSRRGAGIDVEGVLIATDQGEATRIDDISFSDVIDLVENELPSIEPVLDGRF